MNIETFDHLMQAARSQVLPQRMLLVFVSTELPADASPEQRAGFAAGEGGALEPVMCVDRGLEELTTFQNLSAEAAQFNTPWQLVFAAALSGTPGMSLTTEQAEGPLNTMVQRIRSGDIANFLAFNVQGETVVLVAP